MTKHRMTSKKWRSATVAAVVAVSAAGTIGVSTAATSTAAVMFTKVLYDPPGTDTRTNAKLNGEWFQLTNKTSKTVSLTGWVVRDVANHVYRLSGSLAARKSLVVHTGRGTANKPAGHRYWGSGSYVWNNTGDTATLRNSSGKTVHSCKWGRGAGWTTCGAASTQPALPATPATTRPATPLPTPITPPPPMPEGDGDPTETPPSGIG